MTECFNTWGQMVAAGGGVFLVRSYGGIRDRYVNGYLVVHLGQDGRELPTNRNAPWYHRGKRWFSSTLRVGTFSQRQEMARAEAEAWMLKTYGEAGPWARNQMGDVVPTRVNQQFPLRKRKRVKRDASSV